MKTFRLFSSLLGATVFCVAAHGQGFAPANLANAVLTTTIASSTGGANGNGTGSNVLTSTGLDFTLSPSGALTDPVSYTYATTGANTATLTEPVLGGSGTVGVALTFTSASAGTYVATYSAGGTQTGTFTLTAVPAAPPLANMSSRTTLAAGQVAISGIVIGGNVPRRVLVRAIGPGLSQYNITNVLADPNMSLMRGQTVLTTNDDWGSDPATAAAFSASGAFGLTAGSKDSAAVVTLDPGAYTTVIRGGTAAQSGEVLIEVYYLN